MCDDVQDKEPFIGVGSKEGAQKTYIKDNSNKKGPRVEMQSSMSVRAPGPGKKASQGTVKFIAVDYQYGTDSKARVNMPADFRVNDPDVVKAAFRKSMVSGKPVTMIPAKGVGRGAQETCVCPATLRVS